MMLNARPYVSTRAEPVVTLAPDVVTDQRLLLPVSNPSAKIRSLGDEVGVDVTGIGVLVEGMAVVVGVLVATTGVAVGGTGVAVGGMGVAVVGNDGTVPPPKLLSSVALAFTIHKPIYPLPPLYVQPVTEREATTVPLR